MHCGEKTAENSFSCKKIPQALDDQLNALKKINKKSARDLLRPARPNHFYLRPALSSRRYGFLRQWRPLPHSHHTMNRDTCD